VEKCFSEQREKLPAEQQQRFGLQRAHCGEVKVR
jgi:hypothetical protein